MASNSATANIFNAEHKKCLEFVKKSLNESKAKIKIVVTHHVPSKLLIAEEYKDSDLNDAFTVDLTDYIKKCDAKYWIYGHSHRNINKKIGKTYCVCNQMGYISDEEKTKASRRPFQKSARSYIFDHSDLFIIYLLRSTSCTSCRFRRDRDRSCRSS